MAEVVDVSKSDDVQRLADRFSAYYLPVVTGIALLTYLVSRDLLAAVARRFYEDRGAQAAGSLTYTTLLSLVPLLTVALAVSSAPRCRSSRPRWVAWPHYLTLAFDVWIIIAAVRVRLDRLSS